MSHSPEKRRENKEEALRSMVIEAQDQMILTTTFWPSDDRFKDIYDTTWLELEHDYLIESTSPKEPILYRLTGSGWIAGLRLTEIWTSTAFREKAGKLSEMLKRKIKGRHEDVIVELQDVIQGSTLPSGFVYNAIESHLLQELYNIHDAQWDDYKSHLVIPRTFGLTVV
jgi:hypothetical protein